MKLETEIILKKLEEDFLNEIATGLKFLENNLASDALKQELKEDRFGLEWLSSNYLRQYQLYLMGLYHEEFNVHPEKHPSYDL